MVVSKALAARYKELKQQQPDCLLLMQVGAFFQVMNEDGTQHTLIGRQLAFRSLPSKPSTTLGVINV